MRACSSCTLVHQVIAALKDEDGEPVELSLDMATNLYAGLLNDTGGFRFDNTLPFTFEFAPDLDYVRGAHSCPTGALLEGGSFTSDDITNYLGTFTFASLADYNAGRPSTFSQR